MERVRVELGERGYDVVVGTDVLGEVRSMLPPNVRRVAVVTQEGIPSRLIPPLDGLEVSVHHVGTGEEHKNLSTVEDLCRRFVGAGLTRTDAVVGVGGGMVTDIAGFAASVFHRGVPVVHVPTTLLAMIDAAVGGKTGVNLPEGKNLVGAFWQPRGVVCDLDALESLPEREMRCGNGEMAKYHFIAREDLSTLGLAERIARCVRIKASIVAEDEREGGARALLNYGHTLGHALESATNYDMAHGEGVALGILFAAHVAFAAGRIDEARVDQHYDVVHGVYGLKIALPAGLVMDDLIASMRRDKKAVDSLTFVLDSESGLDVVAGVDEGLLRAAWTDFVDRLNSSPD